MSATEAFAARLGGAYYVDDAEIGKVGSCETESWGSFAANADFDWGDRSREVDIHNYYRVPPYWGAY